jgi:IS30 family transposase
MAYTRLSQDERETISQGIAKGLGVRELARTLNRNPGSISREVRRNLTPKGTYSAFGAQERARRLASNRRVRKLEKNPLLRDLVESGISSYWSPEQISKSVQRMFPDETLMHISHESIYAYLYIQGKGTLKAELTRYLRFQRSARRPRTGRVESRGKIPDMISIHERPPEVEDRTIPGHWEGDLIMGARNRTALGTLAERSSRYVLLVPLDGHDAESVRTAFAAAMLRLPEHLRRTLTHDQGKEMAEHRLFTDTTGITVYFADPHSPWQRGTNENTNGLVRQFFPKGTDFSQVTVGQIQWVQDAMNGRPRKTLDWRSPAEVFTQFYHSEEKRYQQTMHVRTT